MGPGHQRLGDIAGETDAAVRNQRDIGAFEGGGDIGDGGDLRHAGAGDDARGADGARTYPHLDPVDPGLGQGDGGGGRGDIATYHLDRGVVALDHAHPLYHVARMAVGGIHHQHIHAGTHQRFYPLIGIRAGAYGGANPQLAIGVLTGQREALGFVEVLDGDHTAQVEIVVHHQDFLDAVLVQQALYLLGTGALLDRDQLVPGGHDLRDELLRVGLETHVPTGDDAHQVLAVQHRHPGDAVGTGELGQLGDGRILLDGDGVLDHTAFEFLDPAYLLGLLGNAHALVDDTDTALLGHGDGQPALGDRVHGGGHQRDVQLYAPGQAGLEGDLCSDHLRVARQQQDIVKCEGFLGDTQHRWVSGWRH